MPILPRETDLYPEDLLLDQNGADSDAQWWAFYTLSRREKELMRRLLALEVPFYCPLVPKRNRSPRGRVRTSHVPLFSGYVFSHGSNEQRQLALTTNCISQSLSVTDADLLVYDLRQIRRLIESKTPLTPESRIQPGTLVRIKTGLLKGLEGVVLKRHSGDRLLVAVEFLQQGASVSLDDFEVEEIG